jgi:tRNA pseudouridine38-40 synthase
MRPLRLTLEFDGSAYHGWQYQPGLTTVQGQLEEALSTVLRTPVKVVGQGRTDAGVHAEGQVAHATADGDDHDLERLRRSLNGLLGPHCAVLGVEVAPEGFHARYSALERTYRYQIVRRPSPLRRRTHWLVTGGLDVAAMQGAVGLFVGEHDFASYCAHTQEMEHTRCVVSSFTLGEDGDVLTFRVSADRFLHNMVRRLVGEMVALGAGRIGRQLTLDRLNDPAPAQGGHTAPAHGLVLERVRYPE